MRKFITRILILYALYLLVIGASSFIFPFYGNEIVRAKFEFLKKQQKQNNINTIYFGSSHVYRQLIPTIIDSLTEHKTHSFNMAGRGTFSFENLYIMKKVLNSNIARPKYVIVEIQSPQNVDDKNIYSDQTIYHANLNTLRKGFEYKQVNKNYKFANLFKSSMLNKIRYRNSFPVNESDKPITDYILKNNGYLSLDDHQRLFNDTYLAKLHKEVFGEDFTLVIENNLKKRKITIGEKWYMNELVDLAKKNLDITFVYFFHPLNNLNCRNVKNQTPKDTPENVHLICMNNEKLIKNLDYYYDRGHLNKIGSIEFSKRIGNYIKDNILER